MYDRLRGPDSEAMMPRSHTYQPSNRLLSALSDAEKSRLEPHLRSVTHYQKDILYDTYGEIDYVYFPLSCVASAITIMSDGSAMEVGSIGKEGLVGHTVGVGVSTSVNRVIVQIPGEALKMSAEVFKSVVSQSDELRELLVRYHTAYLFQSSQAVACNGLHSLDKRCCTWLLMMRDRVDSDELPLTHEFLSMMLGVRRASVSEVLAPLQAAGFLRSHRGLISLLAPAAIEARACECYRQVRDKHARLLA